MFKFIKEYIIDPIKEGIEEGKQELKEEKENEKQKQEEAQNQIQNVIPYNEQFIVGLASLFRAIDFSDWFTLFKKENDKEDDYYPLHLYTFGNENLFKEEDLRKLKNKLKRDFNIVNKETGLEVAADFLNQYSISDKMKEYYRKKLVHYPDEAGKKSGVNALVCCILSYILISSVDVGYLSKEMLMPTLEDIIIFAKKNFKNWEEYGDNILIGEEFVKLNNKLGRKYIVKYEEYLIEKKGSPWNNIKWDKS